MNLVNNENILRLNFEDLVLNYEETKDIIFDFLDVNESIHRFPKKYFKKKSSYVEKS